MSEKKLRILTLHLRRNIFRILLPREDKVWLSIQNAGRNSKHVTELYEADSEISDSDFTTHKTNRFAEEDDYEDDTDCITQSLEPNCCVLVKLAMKNAVKYFVGLIQEVAPNGYNIHFLEKHFDNFFSRDWSHCSSRTQWHSFEVTTISDFRKQL